MKKENLCLSIEATGYHLGLTLMSFNAEGPRKNVKTVFQPKPFQQSELLFPTLNKLMASVKKKQADLDLIAVNNGPGSFTGVRVGVAAARAIAQGLEISLVGVSGLEAMAAQALQKEKSLSTIAACIPALEGELYFAVFQNKKGQLSTVVPPSWGPYKNFAKALQKRKAIRLVGDRADKIKAALPKPLAKAWVSTTCPPNSKAIAELAISRYLKSRMKLYYKDVHPLYLQPSWAERR